jgi:hypothetical protein
MGYVATTKALVLPSQTILNGSSTQGTVIKKTTVAGFSYDTYRKISIVNPKGTEEIKAVIFLKSKADPDPKKVEYNSDSTICNIFILGGGNLSKNDFGIYADKCSTLKLEKVWVTFCNTGFYSSDCFLLNFSSMNISEGEVGITIETGTSLTASTVYCVNCVVGYNLKNLRYSTLNSCACDGASYLSYYFETCQGVTLNSCGAEGAKLLNSDCIFQVVTSNIIINTPFILSNAFYNNGIVFAQNNSQILLNNPSLRLSNSFNKFITAETNSLVTLDELYNTAADLFTREVYNKADKFVELTGGIINKPIKESIFL